MSDRARSFAETAANLGIAQNLLHKWRQALGQSCRVNTVAQLMRQQGITAKSKRKFRHITDSTEDIRAPGWNGWILAAATSPS